MAADSPFIHNGISSYSPTFSPLPPHHHKDGIVPAFCNSNNVEECMVYLNEEVTTLGFPSISSSTNENNNDSSGDLRIQLLNCIYELIQRHRRNIKIQEELETRHLKNSSDLNHLQSTTSRVKGEVEQAEKDNISLVEKVRQLTNQIKSLQSKCKHAKEENKKLEAIIKDRDTQFKHDLKKKERELSKLKDRVHQLLSDKKQERKIGMDILNSLQRSDGKRTTWKTGKTGIKHEEDMYRLIITNYEDRQKELMMENQELRESLSNMQKELVDLLNRQSPEKPELVMSRLQDQSEATSLSSSLEELSTGHFQMPFEMVREGIETSLRQKCLKLKEHIRQIEKENKENKENFDGNVKSDNESAITDFDGDGMDSKGMEKEISRLKDKVRAYKEVVEQQEYVLKSSQDNGMEDSLSLLIRDSHFLEEREILAEERKQLYQEKINFEKERRNFTDAAIRLGQERKRFEEERFSHLQQQLTTSPGMMSQPLRSPKSFITSTSPQNQGPLPSHYLRRASLTETTPPGQTGSRVATPSTVELYRALNLTQVDAEDCLNASQDSLNSIGRLSRCSGNTQSSAASAKFRSGTSTPTSSKSAPLGGASRRVHNAHHGGSATRPKRERTEEHKHNLRKTMAQRKAKKPGCITPSP